MFEAHGWDVLDRISSTHLVVTGDIIDGLAGDGSRGDAIVAKSDCAVVLEFGLQPTDAGAARGAQRDVIAHLARYVSKLRQAIATSDEVLTELVPHLAALRVGRIVVADEPILFSAVHAASVRSSTERVPDMFVISIDELEHLVDLSHAPISVPDALLAWQTGIRKAPFEHHIIELERLVPRNLQRLQAAVHQLYADATHENA
jgi:hypothetical protein